MKASEERAIKARAWSMACHHHMRGVERRKGLDLLLAELASDDVPITGDVAGICQLTYEATREILETGARYEDAFILTVGKAVTNAHMEFNDVDMVGDGGGLAVGRVRK